METSDTVDLIYSPKESESKSNKDFVPQKYALKHNETSHKHTQTAYTYFLEDHRDKIITETDVKFKSQTEFKAYLLDLWENLDQTEKQKYIHKAEQDQVRFRAVLDTKTTVTAKQVENQ